VAPGQELAETRGRGDRGHSEQPVLPPATRHLHGPRAAPRRRQFPRRGGDEPPHVRSLQLAGSLRGGGLRGDGPPAASY
jgi:hypothetical protein